MNAIRFPILVLVVLGASLLLAAAAGSARLAPSIPPDLGRQDEGGHTGDADAQTEIRDENGKADGADRDGGQQRVILYVNRNLMVTGFLELEDDEVIVVRTPEGVLESFAKARILEIVRLVEPKPGQAGVVILRNGRIQEGLILEDAFEYVLMEIEGIRSRLKRPVVHHVILQPSFEEKYEAYRSAIGPNMHEEHLGLCWWLMAQRRYELAEKELKELVAKKETPEARQLLTVVQAQLALGTPPPLDEDAGRPSPANPDGEERETGMVTEKDLLPTKILTHRDVNIIRVYEIDFERPPKLTIGPDTIRQLITSYGTNKQIPASQTGRTAMFRADPIDITRLMFDLRARELYDQIQVLSEPYALNMFRQRVHNTWLMNNCATSRCHGGVHAGRLFLHRRGYKDERVRCTNLLILERLEIDPAWPLINYDDPEMSLIIQHGLPRDQARMPHPDVKGWKPVFRPVNPRLLRDALAWIRSMMQPRPDYPVEYEPPKIGGSGPEDGGEGDDGGRKPR
ncbi:MAG: hypothetical protein JSV91_14930 [Phycisphaerales bacterium]|nr:MAG: hypothetical protein JSV91_14930 [Phycisphaerales bacterium]